MFMKIQTLDAPFRGTAGGSSLAHSKCAEYEPTKIAETWTRDFISSDYRRLLAVTIGSDYWRRLLAANALVPTIGINCIRHY